MAENPVMDRLQALLIADDDERRAIERALHDGVQQQLVALAVELQLARRLLDEDPPSAARLLDEMRAGVGRALDDVRAAAERIHPPLLDAQGLLAALRMAAANAPVPTVVEGSVDGSVAGGTAVTLYRCCVTALACAGAGSARVALHTTGTAVDLEVVLTGGSTDRALDPLAARVQAFGGTLDVRPDRVSVRMPLAS